MDSSFHREKDHNDKYPDKSQYGPNHGDETAESSTKKEDNDRNEATTNSLDDMNKNHEESVNQNDKNSDSKHSDVEDSAKKETKPQYPPKENRISTEKPSPPGSESSQSNQVSDTKNEDSPKPVIPLEIKPTKSSKISEHRNSTSSVDNGKPGDKSIINKTPAKPVSTLNIETSSSVQVIESTTTKLVQSTRVPTDNNPSNSPSASTTVTLEPSRSPDFENTMNPSVPTPTETLPSTFTKAAPITEKTVIHTPANTFTKNTGRQLAGESIFLILQSGRMAINL